MRKARFPYGNCSLICIRRHKVFSRSCTIETMVAELILIFTVEQLCSVTLSITRYELLKPAWLIWRRFQVFYVSSSSEILEGCGLNDVEVVLKKKRLFWFGHMKR